MIDKPLVTVAVITYNHKNFIIQCLDSILNQTYKNIEIVVADDCSKDGTVDIIKGYQKKFPDIIKPLYSDKNYGITANHNLALSNSSGDFISWIGGDDLMYPNKIESQISYMKSNPNCVICYHQMAIVDSDGETLISYFNNSRNINEGLVDKLIKFGTFNCASSSLVRMSGAAGVEFNSKIPRASDWLYWIECLISGGEIRYIDEVLGAYRRHESNVTNYSNNNYKLNIVDHLDTCTIIMAKYPQYSLIGLRKYHKILIDNRALLQVDYDAFFHFFSFKSFVIYIVYKLSFGKIKI